MEEDMHRAALLESLSEYRRLLETGVFTHRSFDRMEEFTALGRLTEFVKEEPGCFLRETATGHVTGSALVTDPTFSKVLLTLHRKLGIWLQLGGHADGESAIEQVALREAAEEGGLTKLELVKLPRTKAGLSVPFDVDVHLIPARKSDPEHYHYDVRYLVVADPAAGTVISEESSDLRWMTLDEARAVTDERSMVRQFDKLEFLRPLRHHLTFDLSDLRLVQV